MSALSWLALRDSVNGDVYTEMFAGGGDVTGDGGGLGVGMAVSPELHLAVRYPKVGGLALVLAGGAGRDGFELRPSDVTGRDVPACRYAGLDEQHGPIGFCHDHLVNWRSSSTQVSASSGDSTTSPSWLNAPGADL